MCKEMSGRPKMQLIIGLQYKSIFTDIFDLRLLSNLRRPQNGLKLRLGRLGPRKNERCGRHRCHSD